MKIKSIICLLLLSNNLNCSLNFCITRSFEKSIENKKFVFELSSFYLLKKIKMLIPKNPVYSLFKEKIRIENTNINKNFIKYEKELCDSFFKENGINIIKNYNFNNFVLKKENVFLSYLDIEDIVFNYQEENNTLLSFYLNKFNKKTESYYIEKYKNKLNKEFIRLKNISEETLNDKKSLKKYLKNPSENYSLILNLFKKYNLPLDEVNKLIENKTYSDFETDNLNNFNLLFN